MRKFRQIERRNALIKTIISCVGWGLLGYFVMTALDGMFWPGWCILTAASMIGAISVDKLLEIIW